MYYPKEVKKVAYLCFDARVSPDTSVYTAAPVEFVEKGSRVKLKILFRYRGKKRTEARLPIKQAQR